VSRTLTVLDPGPCTTVQDRGRPGWAHLGVPRSGALDAAAATLANRLVGNHEGAAVLETTLGGVSVRAGAAMTVAVTGAEAPVLVAGRERAFGEPLSLRAGDLLTVGPARWGVRSYLAVAGGVAVPEVLGSRSTDTLSGTGPGVLRAGDVLPVGEPAGAPAALDVAAVRRPAAPLCLRVHVGPRQDWFADEAPDTLLSSTYTVSEQSNRVGLRLRGPRLAPAEHRLSPDRGTVELPSEGMVLGAVQVPASGEPVVFLNDHPTTGGYPVLAVVSAADLGGCAQLRPGDRVRFAPR
jgi:biotin-dependent carboxylase-like uncharacterized protein